AELLHHTGRVVLEDGVGAGQQALEEVDALGAREVECDRPLADVDAVEQRAPLPPRTVPGPLGAGETHEVRSAGGLDLDDVRPEAGEDVAGRRTRPPRRAVEDAHTGERELPPPLLRSGDVRSPRRGGWCHRNGRAGVADDVRRSWLTEAPGG